jgi:DeoR/GlpR family transcriptional regulator of sugar metabolism
LSHIPRHDDILKIVTHRRAVTVAELTERLGVSEVTIRKDLTMLEEMGSIVRTRGGARLAEDTSQMRSFHLRRQEGLEEKSRIAARARELVKDDDTIYIDSGSTCLLLARLLCDMNLRIVTNSLDVMNVCADAPGISLISLGGSYRKEAGSFIGPMALEPLKAIQIETCFVGATGFSASGIFSSQNIIEAQLKAQVLAVSKRRIILASSAKIDKDAFAVFARPGDVDILVTDQELPEIAVLATLGIDVVVAAHEQGHGESI